MFRIGRHVRVEELRRYDQLDTKGGRGWLAKNDDAESAAVFDETLSQRISKSLCSQDNFRRRFQQSPDI
jgi:hypothetical protein